MLLWKWYNFFSRFFIFFLILDIVLCNISSSVLAYVCIEKCVKISFMYLKNHRSSSLLKLERRVLRKCPGHSKRAPSPYPGFPRAAANFELNSYYHSFCHEILHILAKFHIFWVINIIYFNCFYKRSFKILYQIEKFFLWWDLYSSVF